jgi:septal ring factor EnvC (AmiA/AmiB activator)
MAANAPSTGTNPIWWGLTVAIVVASVAASYRVLTTDGNILVSANDKGLSINVQKAAEQVRQAGDELDALRSEIQAKDAALKKVASDLSSRETEIQKLLTQLEAASKSAGQSAAVAQVNQDLARLRATEVATVANTPKVDWNRYEVANKNLSAAKASLAKVKN